MNLEHAKYIIALIVAPMFVLMPSSCSTHTGKDIPVLVEKDVEIRIIINRESIPEGWSIMSLKANQRLVRIRGPEAVLEKLSYINTSGVTFAKPNGRTARKTDTVQLELPPGVESVQPKTVEVSIGLIKDNEFEEFKRQN